MIAEVIGGVLCGSLALLADAGHMITDAMALALAMIALWIGVRVEDAARTYGFRRAEVLAEMVVMAKRARSRKPLKFTWKPASRHRVGTPFSGQDIRRRIAAIIAKIMPDAKAIDAPDGRLP